MIQYNVRSSAPKYVACKELFISIQNGSDPYVSLIPNRGVSIPKYLMLFTISLGAITFLTLEDDQNYYVVKRLSNI